MKHRTISVSEGAHTQFFSIKSEISKNMKFDVNNDYVIQQLFKAYKQSANFSPILNNITEGMYQLEEKG